MFLHYAHFSNSMKILLFLQILYLWAAQINTKTKNKHVNTKNQSSKSGCRAGW